jgi:hypothetical protein
LHSLDARQSAVLPALQRPPARLHMPQLAQRDAFWQCSGSVGTQRPPLSAQLPKLTQLSERLQSASELATHAPSRSRQRPLLRQSGVSLQSSSTAPAGGGLGVAEATGALDARRTGAEADGTAGAEGGGGGGGAGALLATTGTSGAALATGASVRASIARRDIRTT